MSLVIQWRGVYFRMFALVRLYREPLRICWAEMHSVSSISILPVLLYNHLTTSRVNNISIKLQSGFKIRWDDVIDTNNTIYKTFLNTCTNNQVPLVGANMCACCHCNAIETNIVATFMICNCSCEISNKYCPIFHWHIILYNLNLVTCVNRLLS